MTDYIHIRIGGSGIKVGTSDLAFAVLCCKSGMCRISRDDGQSLTYAESKLADLSESDVRGVVMILE